MLITANLAPIHESGLSKQTRDIYARVLTRALSRGVDIYSPESLTAYAVTLGNSEKTQLKSALRVLTNGRLLGMKAQASPENVPIIQAAEYQIFPRWSLCPPGLTPVAAGQSLWSCLNANNLPSADA